MNPKYIWFALVFLRIGSPIECKAHLDDNMVRTNPNWHITTPTEPLPAHDPVLSHLMNNGQRAWTTNLEEWWHGTWAEDTNGMRVQLDFQATPAGLAVDVQIGSVTTNFFGLPRFSTPNGKFAKFELLDAGGRIIPPKPGAGTDMVKAGGIFYQTNLPAWAARTAGSLVADFPQTISTNVLPLYPDGEPACGVGPVVENISDLNLNELYSITNEGDYTLAVQPVIYKSRSDNSELLDRVSLPCVTTTVHLHSEEQLSPTRQP
jgi:hypothetical protein